MKLLSASIILLHVVCLVSLAPSSQGAGVKWPSQHISEFKDFLIGQVRDRFIKSTGVMKPFQDTMDRISERYNEEKAKLEAQGETDTSALYYKIVIDEIRTLRLSIESERMATPEKEEFKHVAEHLVARLAQVERGEKGSGGDAKMTDQDGGDDSKLDMEMELESEMVSEEREEAMLINQLDELERRAEAEMGWGLTAEHQQQLKERTHHVLSDLVHNELRQLALIVVASHMTGSPAGPVLGSLLAKIKTKLAEFFMHTVMDVLAAVIGHKPPQNLQPFAAPSEVPPFGTPEAIPLDPPAPQPSSEQVPVAVMAS